MRKLKFRFSHSIICVCLLAVCSRISAQEVDGSLHGGSSDSLEIAYLQSEGIPLSRGNHVKLLPSGYEKFEDMFAEIGQAEHYIHMEYFNFRNDSINALLIHLLAQKALEGVEVKVMYDAFGNSSNNRPIKSAQHDSIASLGIEFVKFDPIRFPWVNHIFPRDHRKIVVIDGRVGYTGGMNVADYYIDGLDGIGPWRDMHMHIEGPAVADLHHIFSTMWERETHEVIDEESCKPKADSVVGNMLVGIVDRMPGESPKSIRHLYISMLDNAQQKVRIINPYFVPTHKTRKALKRTIKRGVEVEILLSEKSDIPLTPDASHHVGRNLAKKGAKVYMFNGGFHHTKAMVVDDHFCTIGSSNLDARSLRCDHEVNTVIFDQSIAQQMVDMIERDKEQSVPLTDDYWKRKSCWRRFVGWLGNLLTPFL